MRLNVYEIKWADYQPKQPFNQLIMAFPPLDYKLFRQKGERHLNKIIVNKFIKEYGGEPNSYKFDIMDITPEKSWPDWKDTLQR